MAFPSLGMFVCKWKRFLCCTFPQIALSPLGLSEGTESHWIQRVWTRPAIHNDPGQITMATHTLLCFSPVLHPPTPSHVDQVMNCFPHFHCLACAVALSDSRRSLGTALLSLSLAPKPPNGQQLPSLPNLHTVSDSLSAIKVSLLFYQHWQMVSVNFINENCD